MCPLSILHLISFAACVADCGDGCDAGWKHMKAMVLQLELVITVMHMLVVFLVQMLVIMQVMALLVKRYCI